MSLSKVIRRKITWAKDPMEVSVWLEKEQLENITL